jgi:hypothetical protein
VFRGSGIIICIFIYKVYNICILLVIVVIAASELDLELGGRRVVCCRGGGDETGNGSVRWRMTSVLV